MITTHGTSSSNAPARVARRPLSLQDWLEKRGAVAAFAIAVVAMMLRGAEFYSGGAFSLSRALGPAGTNAFNIVTGIGLAVGCELVGSIAGRDWLWNDAEALEVDAQRGLTKIQRAARKKAFAAAGFRSFIFMWLTFAASYAAAAYYSITGTGAHTFWPIVLDLLIAAALETVVIYLGVFKQSHADASSEVEELGHDLHLEVMRAAAERIRAGIHSLQDVRIVAGAMRGKTSEQFQAAYVTTAGVDPMWSTRDIMLWLGGAEGATSEALRKRVNRRLAVFMKAGEPVTKDAKSGGYRIPKGEAGRLFMDDYLAMRDTVLATQARQVEVSKPGSFTAGASQPETRAGSAQDAASA